MSDKGKWLIWLAVFVVGSLALVAAGYVRIVGTVAFALAFWILAGAVLALIVKIRRRRK